MLVADALRLGGAILTQYPDLVSFKQDYYLENATIIIKLFTVSCTVNWPPTSRSWS